MSVADEARRAVADANAICVFTGAGVAAESGIPTFRGEDGLWVKYSPAVWATPRGLAMAALTQPRRFKQFVRDVTHAFLEAEPNAGHTALGRLARSGRLLAVVTQNIDDLHERGGAAPVIKLHGDLLTARCTRCEHTEKVGRDELRRRVQRATRGPLWWGLPRLLSVYPRCPRCRGLRRPHVVFFGEALSADDCRAAERAMEQCDLLLVSGTSGDVYPANLLPEIAHRRAVPFIEVSPEPTPFTGLADYHLPARFAEALPLLLD